MTTIDAGQIERVRRIRTGGAGDAQLARVRAIRSTLNAPRNSHSEDGDAMGDAPGLLERGNIDLGTRPVVKNDDGSISTVRSMSVNLDGREILIPTVSDDGRIMPDDEAVETFKRTGRHLGMFDSPESATAYAQRLHEQQAAMYAPPADPRAAAVLAAGAPPIRPAPGAWAGASPVAQRIAGGPMTPEAFAASQAALDEATARTPDFVTRADPANAVWREPPKNQGGVGEFVRAAGNTMAQAVPPLIKDELRGTMLGNAIERAELAQPPQGAAGFAGQVVGGLPTVLYDTQRLPENVASTLGPGMAMKAALPVVDRIANPMVRQLVVEAIQNGVPGASVAIAQQAARENWEEDPAGALGRTLMAGGIGAGTSTGVGMVAGAPRLVKERAAGRGGRHSSKEALRDQEAVEAAGAAEPNRRAGEGEGQAGAAAVAQPTASAEAQAAAAPAIDLKQASHAELKAEADRLGVTEGPTNRRALQDRIRAAQSPERPSPQATGAESNPPVPPQALPPRPSPAEVPEKAARTPSVDDTGTSAAGQGRSSSPNPNAQPLSAMSFVELRTEAARLGVEDGPTNRRAIMDRIEQARAQEQTAGESSPSERGAGDALNAEGAGTPAEPPATAPSTMGRVGSQPPSTPPPERPFTDWSYRELAAEAERLGVPSEGPQNRLGLIKRIEAARAGAREGQPAEKPTKHEFSSTQVDLPDDVGRDVRAAAAKIPDEDLAKDGREDRPHITVKFGLHTDDAAEVARALQAEGPIKVKLGKTSLFENDDADVVKVDVDGPDIRRLNQVVADAVEHTDTHKDYKPHVTLAYVKKGKGQAYVGDSPLSGREVELDRVVFSDRNGNETVIPLTGRKEGGGEGVRDPGQERPVAGGGDDAGSARPVGAAVEKVVGDEGAPAGDKPGDVGGVTKADMSAVPEVPDAPSTVDQVVNFGKRLQQSGRAKVAAIDRRVAELRKAAPPGSRPGHGAGFDYALAYAEIVAGKAIETGAKTGAALGRLVRETLEELKPGVRVSQASVGRIAKALLKDATDEVGAIDPSRLRGAVQAAYDASKQKAVAAATDEGIVNARQAKDTAAGPKTALNVERKMEKRTRDQAVRGAVASEREGQAINARQDRKNDRMAAAGVRLERDMANRATRSAVAAARREARATALEEGRLELDAVRERLTTQRRDQVTAVRTIGVMERRAQADRFKQRQAEQQEVRDTLTRIVREYLPTDLQGRFLGDVARVRNVGQMVRVADRVRDAMAEAQVRDSMRAATRAAKAVPQQLLAELRTELKKAKDELARIRGTDGAWKRVTNVNARDRMSAQLGDLRDRFVEIAHQQREFEKVRVAGKVLRREEVVTDGVKSIEKKSPLPFRAELEEARDAKPIMRLRQMLMNPESVGAATGDPTLRRILSEDFWDGETATNRDSQAGQDALKDALEKAGYKWGSDKLRKLSRAAEGDDATIQTMKLPDAGEIKATPGEWMALYATLDDAKAGANLRAGTPINWSRYPQGKALKLTPRDLEAVGQQLDPKLRQVVHDAKAFVESEIRPKVFAAFREQKGYDLVPVDRYWRTRRNRQAMTGEGIINTTRAQFNKALENLGFLREREPDTKTPYLIGDFFGDYGEIVHQGATVANMTRRVRNAELVFKDPRMKAAIESRFGRDMNGRIETIIENAKLLFGEDPALPDRIMHKLSRNVARAKLQLNPRSMAKNLGGVFKLLAEMDPKDVASGLKKAADSGVRERMMRSAYFRDRYEHAVWARVTPMRDRRTPALGEAGWSSLARDLVRLKRPRGAVMDMIDRIRVYDSVDKLVSAAVWAGKEAEAARRGIPEKQRAAWVEREAELVMRRTQNGHSSLERSEVGDWGSKGGVASLVTPFTSDANKSLNMLLTAASEDPKKLRRVAAAVTLNNIWAAAVDTAWKAGLVAGGAVIGASAKKREDRKKKPGPLEEFGWRFLNNTVGMAYGGDLLADWMRHAVQAYQGYKPGFLPQFSNPAFSAMQQAGEGLVELVESGSQTGRMASGPDRGKSRRWVHFWRGFEKAALGGADLAGVPLSPLWYMYKAVTD